MNESDLAENNILNETMPDKLVELKKDIDDYLTKVRAGLPVPNTEFNPKKDEKLKYAEMIEGLMNGKL